MTNKIAIIIGNGTSRKEVELNKLVGHGTIYGCNALYRDFDGYDHLIAIDDGMIEEIKDNPKALIPPADERFESSEYNPFARRRSNAGMNAIYEAIKAEHDVLYCIGFDFFLDGEMSVDNMYKDTQNYGPETHANQADNYYRVKYLEWFGNRFPSVQFVFVIPDGVSYKSMENENFIAMNTSTFINKLEA